MRLTRMQRGLLVLQRFNGFLSEKSPETTLISGRHLTLAGSKGSTKHLWMLSMKQVEKSRLLFILSMWAKPAEVVPKYLRRSYGPG